MIRCAKTKIQKQFCAKPQKFQIQICMIKFAYANLHANLALAKPL